MAVNKTTIRVNARLAEEAKKLLGMKSRVEAVRVALIEIVGLSRFKALMKKNAGKLKLSAAGK